MKKMETTLCLLRRENEVLLAMKKRGFGAGKYNGIGGKIELGETPSEAMIRETKEEINVTPTDYKQVGLIEFDEYYNGERQNLVFYLYEVNAWEGNIEESDEMKPEWFHVDDIPYYDMFPDDIYWLPLVLDGKQVKAYFEFDEDFNILSKKVEEVKDTLYFKSKVKKINKD